MFLQKANNAESKKKKKIYELSWFHYLKNYPSVGFNLYYLF